MRLTLTRSRAQPPGCTLGSIVVSGVTLWTLERPWVPSQTHIGGMPGRSCVPPGTYKLEPHSTEAHPRTVALVNPALGVTHWGGPGLRSAVLVHAANRVEELRGCIALGMARSQWPHGWEISQSRMAVAIFQNALADPALDELAIVQL